MASKRHAAQIVLPEDPDQVGFIGFMDNGKFSVHDQAISDNNIWKSRVRSSDWLIPNKHHVM